MSNIFNNMEYEDASQRLLEVLKRLTALLAPDRIYLFGSRARGDANADSDYDLFVVVHASQLPRYRREQEAFRALCGLGVSTDVIVFTRDEFERGKKVVTSLPSTVEREGRLLYAG
jgi:predicted nucleotidyltransferase